MQTVRRNRPRPRQSGRNPARVQTPVRTVPSRAERPLEIKRQRGTPGGRNRHLSGRNAPIPARVIGRLLAGLKISRSGCWIPDVPRLKNGYSVSYWHEDGTDRTLPSAHVMARVAFRGGKPLGDQQAVHHECTERACINPAHLTVLTHAQHRMLHQILRMVS